ncbi:MAG: type III-A CRISPR-associated RAMP protein Csm3 [Anaerostipes sp.]|nr:type III-A CRISPR-associated RAMP protein Csm3 [Anaerostipes sp.]
MLTKIQITGELEVVTGMHIGGNSQFAAIGAVDSPVIRDKQTDLPMIPGSSIKGKMRSLLSKYYSEKLLLKTHSEDPKRVLRLFGSSDKDYIRPSRIICSDMILSNSEELEKYNLHSATEVKFENTINRATAAATPRQIERVIRGSKFKIDFIYNVEKVDEIQEDLETLAQGFKLLEYDYIGGHGSRGYGKVQFQNVKAKNVLGVVDEIIIRSCNQMLGEI